MPIKQKRRYLELANWNANTQLDNLLDSLFFAACFHFHVVQLIEAPIIWLHLEEYN